MFGIGWIELLVVVVVAAFVISVVVSRSRPTTVTIDDYRPPAVSLDDETVRAVTDRVQRGKQVEAIVLLRAATGLSLKDSKGWVDHWDPARVARGSSRPASASPTAATSPTPADLAVEARGVLAVSGDVAAVKHVRARTGWGLLEAKTYVDTLQP